MFNKQERSGILFLVLLITGLLSVYYFVDFSKENILDISSPEISAIQKQIDSLRTLEIERRKPKSFPFNPNYITDFKGYTLGMNTEEIDRLKKYRDEGKWINSKSDFKRVTNVSDSLLKKISPYFKFPEWITNPESSKKSNFKNYSEKTFEQKTDLNKATVIQLQKVNGIGDVLSKRIITYRKKLGGYTSDIQLYNVSIFSAGIAKFFTSDFLTTLLTAIILSDLKLKYLYPLTKLCAVVIVLIFILFATRVESNSGYR